MSWLRRRAELAAEGNAPALPVAAMRAEAGGSAAPEPGRTESVTEFLARAPHEFLLSRAFSGPLAGLCECKLAQARPVHGQDQDRAMPDTAARLAGIAAQVRPEGDWRHREAPAGAGPVMSEGGWLADGPGGDPRQEAEAGPGTVPLDKPEPLPGGVIGYVVALKGVSRDALADADLRPTLKEARADAMAIGKRPGWSGRAFACEVRAAEK